VQSKKTATRFGDIATRLGYARPEDIEDALKAQRERVARGETHKLIGLVLLEKGAIDTEQLIDILKHYA
jgi:hypothetical protein